MREDVYHQAKLLLESEQADIRAMYPDIARVFGPDGWDDPSMDIYNDLDPRRSP